MASKVPPLWLLALAWWPLTCLLLAFVISTQNCDPGLFIGDIPLYSSHGVNVCRGRADVYLTQTFPAVPRLRVEGTMMNTTSDGRNIATSSAVKMTLLVAIAVCQEDEGALGWIEGLCDRPGANWRVFLYHKCNSAHPGTEFPRGPRTERAMQLPNDGSLAAASFRKDRGWPRGACIEHVWGDSHLGQEAEAYLAHILRFYHDPLLAPSLGNDRNKSHPAAVAAAAATDAKGAAAAAAAAAAASGADIADIAVGDSSSSGGAVEESRVRLVFLKGDSLFRFTLPPFGHGVVRGRGGTAGALAAALEAMGLETGYASLSGTLFQEPKTQSFRKRMTTVVGRRKGGNDGSASGGVSSGDGHRQSSSSFTLEEEDEEERFVCNWAHLKVLKRFDALPPGLNCLRSYVKPSGAEFVVSPQRVKKVPFEAWQKLHALTTELPSASNPDLPDPFEHTWAVLFGCLYPSSCPRAKRLLSQTPHVRPVGLECLDYTPKPRM